LQKHRVGSTTRWEKTEELTERCTLKLSDENLGKLSSLHGQLRSKKTRRKRKSARRWERALSEHELLATEGNPIRRRRFAHQGTRGHRGGPLHPPGLVFSVQLERCKHRARVEVLASGRIPARASCPHCRRWSGTVPETARVPLPNATRKIVGERVEEREGRAFQVQVLATPRRARTGKSGGEATPRHPPAAGHTLDADRDCA
jgi:hypothetical protein